MAGLAMASARTNAAALAPNASSDVPLFAPPSTPMADVFGLSVVYCPMMAFVSQPNRPTVSALTVTEVIVAEEAQSFVWETVSAEIPSNS